MLEQVVKLWIVSSRGGEVEWEIIYSPPLNLF